MRPPSIEPEKSGPLHFLHINAAIDVERLTGDILPVDNQVTNGASDLLRGPNAPQGDALENGLLHLLWNDFILPERGDSIHLYQNNACMMLVLTDEL